LRFRRRFPVATDRLRAHHGSKLRDHITVKPYCYVARQRKGIGRDMQTNRNLTDSQWAVLDLLIPEPSRRKDGRGRPWRARRAVLDGILWVLRTGAPWADLPDRYPPYQTCHRRFQQWVQSGILKGFFEALAADLLALGLLHVGEAFIDGSFAPAKKGAPKSERPSAEKEPRSWLWQIAMVCLLAFP
jgi:transposase